MRSAGPRIGPTEELARAALAHYGVDPDVAVDLLHESENVTFSVEEPGGRRWALRVHRPDYQTPRSIDSELAWMSALATDAGVRTPGVRRARNGQRVVEVLEGATGRRRSCVLFEWLPGRHPADDDAASFERLGALSARMHRHSRHWRRPRHFERFAWDLDAAFGPHPRWGHWQNGLGVGPPERAVLTRLEATLRRRLTAYGTGPDRFGLVHADTRLANLLVHEGDVCVIDFDDCGFSWFLYDLATAFSFFEDAPQVPELIDRWLTGYRSVAPLDHEHEHEIWTFVLFRRLLLVAWLGSHPSVDLAAELGAGYTAGTCELAERYLAHHA